MSLPNSVLFWGGPLDGEVKWVDSYTIKVPVFLEPFLDPPFDHAEATTSVRLEYVEYYAHLYLWNWKGYAREATVMTTRFADTMRVEAIMQFLEKLWGNHEI